MSGIESSTLRYWDEIGIFSPIKRNENNNYRYYSPEQIITVNFFTVLSNLNVPLKTMGAMEGDRYPEGIIELIDTQEKFLDDQMRKLREAYSVIHTRRELIKQGLKADESKISVVNLPEKRMVLGPEANFKDGEPFYEPFSEFGDKAPDLRINLNYPIGGLLNSYENFLKSPGEPDHFFSFDPTGNHIIPAGEYLVAYHRGYYGDFGDLTERVDKYVRENNLTLGGPVYCLYLLDEICEKDPSNYLVCVTIPVLRQ